MGLSEFPVYVLSVRTFLDRHESIKEQALRLGFDPSWIFEHDADKLTTNDHEKFAEKSDLPDRTKSLVLKHFAAMQQVVSKEIPYALILEDDVIFFDDAQFRLEKIFSNLKPLSPGFLIFLGGADNKIDSRFLTLDRDSLVEAAITTTEAYIVDYEGCVRRLEHIERHGIELPSDHQLQMMDPLLGIKHYKIADPICAQGSITGLFDTKLDDSRKKHSKKFIKIRYAYNRFRRQVLPRFIRSFWK